MEHVLAEEAPDAVRLFFKTCDGLHRQFLQFRGRGDDLYWGPPGKCRRTDSRNRIVGPAIRITIDENTDQLVSTQVSYHESGQVHVKQSGQYVGDGPMNPLPAPRDLEGPIRAGVMFTAQPRFIKPYTKPLPEGSSVVIHLPEEAEALRFQVDIFFTPVGSFYFPVLNGQGIYDGDPDFCLTVTSRLLVVGWLTPAGTEDFHDWCPEESILIAGLGQSGGSNESP